MIRPLSPAEPASDRRAEFEQVALPYRDSLYRLARRLTRSQHEAEDLVQETYLRAFRSFHSFRRGTNCRAWLLRILTNLSTDRFARMAARKDKVGYADMESFPSRAQPGEDSSGSGAGTPFDYGNLLDDDVKQAVEGVPPVFRTPLLLSTIKGLSYSTISRVLGCPMGTVMSRIHRGRQALRRNLSAYAQARGYHS